MHHHLLTRTRAAVGTLALTAVMVGCSDPGPDGSEDVSAAASSPASAPAISTPKPRTDSPPVSSPTPPAATSGVPSASAAATPTPPAGPPAPPFIASTVWADSDYGRTLKISPTLAGRRAWGIDDSHAAWREVLRRHPDADVPGMWEQFDCHWTWARILEPDKPTWNVEPWRPVVTAEQMLVEGCNPGGPEV